MLVARDGGRHDRRAAPAGAGQLSICPNLPVTVMELDLEALLAGWGAKQEMDAILVPAAGVRGPGAASSTRRSRPGQVATLIRQSGGKLLVDVRLFDVYRGGQVPAGKKSLAYSLTFQAPDRTLTAEDTAKAAAEDRRTAGAGSRGRAARVI